MRIDEDDVNLFITKSFFFGFKPVLNSALMVGSLLMLKPNPGKQCTENRLQDYYLGNILTFDKTERTCYEMHVRTVSCRSVYVFPKQNAPASPVQNRTRKFPHSKSNECAW